MLWRCSLCMAAKVADGGAGESEGHVPQFGISWSREDLLSLPWCLQFQSYLSSWFFSCLFYTLCWAQAALVLSKSNQQAVTLKVINIIGVLMNESSVAEKAVHSNPWKGSASIISYYFQCIQSSSQIIQQQFNQYIKIMHDSCCLGKGSHQKCFLGCVLESGK